MPWPTAPLAELLEDARSGFASGEVDPGGTFQVRMNNVTREGRWELGKRRRIPASAGQLTRFGLEPGDVLFNATNSPDLVGKTALLAERDEPMVFSNHFIRLRANRERLEPAYLARWLQRQFDLRIFQGMCRQWVNQATVGRDALLALPLPLPPIKEQRRIVDILDRAETIRTKRRKASAHLHSLTHSIFLDMFGHPSHDPQLSAQSLLDLCDAYSGGTPSKARGELWNGSVPWFSPKDIKRTELSDSEDHIAASVPATTSLRLLPAGTVLMVVRGMILAHTVPISVTTVPATINQDLKAFIPRKPIDPTFLLWAIRSQHDHILTSVSTAAHGTKRLDAQALGSIVIPRPGYRQELHFAERAAAVRAMLHHSREASTTLDGMYASLQQRAFAGEL